MSEQKQKIIEKNINQYIFRLINLDNNDLLVLLETNIKCLKSPNYALKDSLDITFDNTKIDSVCIWKNNHIIVKTPEYFYVIQLYLNNTKYRIISKFNLYKNISLRLQKMIPLNNYTKILLNTFNKIIILEETQPFVFQTQKALNYKIRFNSIIQIKKNLIVSNSSEIKKVFFINIQKGKILSEINNIQTYISDADNFCFINKNIIGMGGDLRDGIYFFDINQRELIYHYKEDWRGYHCLLNIGNNKFLGESYCGRCYGESDDELEELYCTHFFRYDEKKNKIIPYKYSVDRAFSLKRSNFIKFNNIDKIAYSSNKNIYIENL